MTEHTSAFRNEASAVGNSVIAFASSRMYNPIRDGGKKVAALIYLQALAQ